ncbi:hypothetical protein AVEN_256853-1 [Araneus ventricosus]|uniref:Uncharacterized protein n=1 Tax=Araneus ventricosus TaxID=182803 RepID=A0A4Y2QDU6_ARAVE|nr:hypothetical protein AVEN_256853-1 [Araneus ventricosus]
MVTSKLALTCFKPVASLHSCHVKLVSSLHSCHVKFVVNLLQAKIVIWGPSCRGKKKKNRRQTIIQSKMKQVRCQPIACTLTYKTWDLVQLEQWYPVSMAYSNDCETISFCPFLIVDDLWYVSFNEHLVAFAYSSEKFKVLSQIAILVCSEVAAILQA